jgi:antitoxin (DNA-binding transcriptional repressor) of toxin-antitoxin stability system
MVALEIFKDRLSEYIRLAQSGETILLTDGERVVAELAAPRQPWSPSAPDDLLGEMVRKGWVTPPSRRLKCPPPRAPVMSFEELMGELDGDRTDR